LSLREKIIAEMKTREEKQKAIFGEQFVREAFAWYCTWWFKFGIPSTTAEIRRELEKMEREKIVIANREQSNNTKWMLVVE
jgi:hypothetical protein